MKRYIVKKRKIAGRGGSPKIDEWYIIDTSDGRPWPGGAHIHEGMVNKLCDSLNNFHDSEEVCKSFTAKVRK